MKNFPLVEYADCYFEHCEYSAEQLYDLQKKILELIDNKSQDIGKEAFNLTKIDLHEIEVIMGPAFKKGLVKQQRIAIAEITPDHKIPFYRYSA